jgi:hypothetical protein
VFLLSERIRLVDIIEDGGYDLPNWQKAVAGLAPEEAAARMNALRSAVTSPSAYCQLRARERAERERQADLEEEAAFAERRAAWLAENAASDQAAAENVTEAAPATEEPTVADPPAAPASPPVMTREAIQAARKRREKMARATRSKVAADKANAKNAEAFAKQRVADLERVGKL